jgi:TonB family protein
MGPSSNHNAGYTREDLLRYIAGQMPAAEMHALEKAALEDPFLADALEGLQQEHAEVTKKHFADLDQRLASRTDTKVIPMPKTNWWRAAIAAALIGCIGIAVYFFAQRNETVPVVAQKTSTGNKDTGKGNMNEMQLPKSEEQDTEEPIAQTETKIDKPIETKSSSDKKDKKTQEEKLMPAPSPAAPMIANQESKKEMDRISPSVAAGEKAAVLQETQANKDMRSSKQRPGINEKMPGVYYFTGQVTDNNNKPVPFANIAIRNTQRTTYTDAKGNFRVVAGDSTLDVDIKSVGYITRTIHLSNVQPNQEVVLQPARTAKAKTMVKPAEPEDTDTADLKMSSEDLEKPDAEPRDGFAAYQFYLLNNVRVPSEAKNSGIKGSVDVSFLVNDNGRLSDFKIERSLGPAFDKEAIRLIREGPPWVLYNSETGIRTKITVTF